MRFARIALLLPLSLTLGTPFSATAAPEEPAHPIQVRVRVEHVVFKDGIFPKNTSAAVTELREKGWVTDASAAALRAPLAAAISSQQASARDQLTITMLDGVGGEISVADKNQPGLGATFLPRVINEKIRLDLKVLYGKRTPDRFAGPTVEQKATVASGGTIAVWVPGTKELPAEHVVFLHVTRLAE
ncbi:MAG: hypothetical protein K0Q72_2295 [Armatimonadetes bacterium]|jgi:hypothetical protein|nr:hypothetical protein [Armatimonadota bacterium]